MRKLSRKSFIRRTRCMNLLKRESHRSLTFLEASAGYGKTTLLTMLSNTIASKGKLGWLTLEHDDNNPDHLLHHFITTLSPLDKDHQYEWSDLLHQKETNGNHPRSILLDKLVNILNNQGEIHLMIDQYESIYEQNVHRIFEYFINHSNDNVHYYFASREKLPFHIINQRIQYQALILTSDHLKFDINEIDDFVKLKIGFKLQDSELQSLYSITEGWPFAVSQYVSLLDGSRARPLNEHSAIDALPFELHDFFLHEVFLKQCQSLQQFILKLSIPDFFNAELSFVLTDNEQYTTYFKQLLQKNLFMIQDSNGNYRYHPLFSQFLRAYLKQFDKDQFLFMHQRCSEWFEEQGFLIEAVQHTLHSQNYERASLLLLKDIIQTFSYPKSRLIKVLEQFPRLEMKHRPSVAMLYAWLLTVNQRLTTAETILDQLEACSGNKPLVFEPTGEDLRGYIASIKSRIHFLRHDTENGMTYLKEAKSRLNGQGFLYSHVNTIDKYESSLLKSSVGQWGAVDQSLLRWKVAEPFWRGVNKGYGLSQILHGECYYERRQLTEAEKHLLIGRRIGIDLMETGLILPSTLTLVQLMWSRGEKQGAQILMEETRKLLMQKEYRDVWSILDACQARLHIKTNQLQPLKKWLRHQTIKLDGVLDIRYFYEYLTMLRAFTYLRQFERGIHYGERLLHFSQSMNLHYYIAEIHILLAISYENKEQSSTAFHHLSKALKIGQKEGYIQLFLEDWELYKTFLEKYLKLVETNQVSLTPEIHNYYKQLLLHGSETEFIDNKIIYAKNKLTPTEYKVLQYLIERKSNAFIAKEMSITIETAKTHCKNIYRKLHLKSRREVYKKFSESL